MRGRAKVFFWGCTATLFFVVGICFLTQLTDLEYSKNEEFMENSEAYDVLFFGNSHMVTGVYPMELWRDYGIASYNLAGYGNRIPVTYWVVKNALSTANPMLVVVDCNNVRLDEKIGRTQILHRQTDQMPLNADKIQMICDLVEEPKERLEFFWDFAAYHDRWWDLDQADFEKEINVQKGAEFACNVVPPAEMAKRPGETVAIQSLGVEYLQKIIKECQNRDIEILLTYLPFPASEEERQEAVYVEQLAREYGVPYINFLDMQVVDLEVDCSDKDSHLNGSGGRKITDYIGQYIEEQYDIPNRREDGSVNWDEDYATYQRYKINKLQSQESLQNHLVMMADKSFSYCLFVDARSRIWDYEQYVNQVRNLVPDHEWDVLEEVMGQGEDYCLIVDNLNGEVAEYGGEGAGTVETSFGKVTYTEDENGSKALYFGDSEESYLAEENRDGVIPTVQVILVNNLDGTVVNVERFDEMLRVTR